MENPPHEEAIKFATFGRRKVAPRVCIADGKRHIRKFLGEALEELGFITCECTQVGELSAVLDGQAPDLVIVGLSTGGTEAAGMLEALAARSFDGKVLLLGPRDSLMLAAVQELGEQRGIAMLPTLATPFDSRSLGNSVAPLLPTEALPSPVIEAAEALSRGWVELWYQPKFDTHTLALRGAEALIRVRHPAWGIIAPAYFLSDKDDPFLSALSEFVIGRAVEDWRNFVQHRAIEISINLPMIFFKTQNRSRLCAGRCRITRPSKGLSLRLTPLISLLTLAWLKPPPESFGSTTSPSQSIILDRNGRRWLDFRTSPLSRSRSIENSSPAAPTIG